MITHQPVHARRVAGAAAAAVLAVTVALVVHRGTVLAAATCTVNSTGDAHASSAASSCASTLGAGVVTLRSALEHVSTVAGSTSVAFSLPSPSTISLKNGALSLSGGNVTITGQGMSATIVDAHHASRLLDTSASSTTITDMTLENGEADRTAGINGSNLSLTRVRMTGNVVPGNPNGNSVFGVVADSGTVTISDSVFSSNSGTATAQNDAGEVFGGLFDTGDITVTRSQITNNTLTAGLDVFGGIFDSGTTTLTDTAISGNTVTSAGRAFGGLADTGDFSLTRSGIGPNTVHLGSKATAFGGLFDTGNVVLNNSTIGQNAVTMGAGATVFGGVFDSGTFTATNATIANNTMSVGSGSAGAALDTGTVTLTNTIISGNTPVNCGTAAASSDHSIDSGTSCGLGSSNGNKSSTNPKVGPMQVNSPGTTPTMALLAGSPAIDAADTSKCPSTDQRGVTRVTATDPVCDIGAFEVRAAAPTPTPTPTATSTPTATAAPVTAPATGGGAATRAQPGWDVAAFALVVAGLAGVSVTLRWSRRRR